MEFPGGLKIADTAAFIHGIFYFSRYFGPDAFNGKRGIQPEKNVMFRLHIGVGFKHRTALLITSL
jgi:hypothetical protein